MLINLILYKSIDSQYALQYFAKIHVVLSNLHRNKILKKKSEIIMNPNFFSSELISSHNRIVLFISKASGFVRHVEFKSITF